MNNFVLNKNTNALKDLIFITSMIKDKTIIKKR
jgi:hypothetical protein